MNLNVVSDIRWSRLAEDTVLVAVIPVHFVQVNCHAWLLMEGVWEVAVLMMGPTLHTRVSLQ